MSLGKLAQCLEKAVKSKALSAEDAADLRARAERAAKNYEHYMD